uniref:Uncharacterized protein n=1 Tax=Trichogramma kaykai TaxID=54128 RepID=A0ABD2WPQ5_9HYME
MYKRMRKRSLHLRFTTCASDFIGMRHLAAQTPLYTKWNSFRKSFTQPSEHIARIKYTRPIKARGATTTYYEQRYKSAYYLYSRNYTLPLARATFAGYATWRSVSNFKVEYNQVRVFSTIV